MVYLNLRMLPSGGIFFRINKKLSKLIKEEVNMSWNISLVDNTVEITKKCAKELLAIGGNGDPWYDLDDLEFEEGRYELGFNDDHMEHMDYLSHREDILAVLLKHKVNGDITFTCSEGDWAGENWGYRFTNGSMKKLVGKIIFVEEDEDEDE